MASREFWEDQMRSAMEIMDDKSKPPMVRYNARARFRHCINMLGPLEGPKEVAPREVSDGHYLVGYNEIAQWEEDKRRANARDAARVSSMADHKKQRNKQKYADLVMDKFQQQERADKRAVAEQRAAVQIKAREAL